MTDNEQITIQIASHVREWLEEEVERGEVQYMSELLHDWIMDRYNESHRIYTDNTIVAPTPPEVREQGRR
jgi:hypothetical protein